MNSYFTKKQHAAGNTIYSYVDKYSTVNKNIYDTRYAVVIIFQLVQIFVNIPYRAKCQRKNASRNVSATFIKQPMK